MKHHDHVAHTFGASATAYLTSEVHATGEDLAHLASTFAATRGHARVLDMGCGAGHASFAVAPHAREVVAYDIAVPMLDTVARVARERGLTTIRTQQGAAESLPFADASFDWAISRMSAHHWRNVPAALAEARRVLTPEGRLTFIDVAGVDDPLFDTHIQAIELLRDSSHIRDYRASEWLHMLEAAGFSSHVTRRGRIAIDFDTWVARMRTPPDRVTAIRSLWTNAPDEVRHYFGVQPDGSFELDVLMIDAASARVTKEDTSHAH
ncbi:MAG: methyltransferase domain-containing protein [Acidobacteriaceae bacterium]|jgi:ubiquinone/menaquinone biosynthesis C-methylase UbiE|nr:methyltransferase domain-containing protein [Acidobacteriaceae bacterium]